MIRTAFKSAVESKMHRVDRIHDKASSRLYRYTYEFLWQGGPNVGKIRENLEIPEIRKTRKTKIQVSPLIFWEFRPENPFLEVSQSSCIFWDAQNPFSRRFIFWTFSDLAGVGGKKPKKDPKLVPFPLPLKKTAPGTMPKLKNARLGGP